MPQSVDGQLSVPVTDCAVGPKFGKRLGQVEILRQRQADSAGQGQLVFFQCVLRNDQLLLDRLVIHAGPQLSSNGAVPAW